jgi:L-ribulose-5-phosphate 4-epimerase
MVIKPSGVEYAVMTADDIWWWRSPAAKSLKAAKNLFRYANASGALSSLPQIGGIVHTHSRHATIWSQAGLDLPAWGTTHADYFYGAIPAPA